MHDGDCDDLVEGSNKVGADCEGGQESVCAGHLVEHSHQCHASGHCFNPPQCMAAQNVFPSFHF